MRLIRTLLVSSCLAVVFALAPSGVARAQEAPPPRAPSQSTPWLGLEQRSVFGIATARATQDYGADLLGGVWLLHGQVRPMLDVGWSRVFGGSGMVGGTIDTFRAGGRVAMGESLAGDRVWMGVAVGMVAEAGWYRQQLATTSPGGVVQGPGVTVAAAPSAASVAWTVSPSLSTLLQARIGDRFLLGTEVGVEHAIPALQWADYSVFNGFRLQLGLQLGVILG